MLIYYMKYKKHHLIGKLNVCAVLVVKDLKDYVLIINKLFDWQPRNWRFSFQFVLCIL